MSELVIKYQILFENIQKYLIRLALFIDFIPIAGPIYNASFALNLLWSIWSMSDVNDPDDLDPVPRSKSRRIREKGLTAIVTSLIDVFVICLAVAVIAFVCDGLNRIQTFSIVRNILMLVIILNLLALTIGSKIIANQLIIHLTRQLEDVNHVGKSMVKSVTIATSAIERIAETTETTTNYVMLRLREIGNRILFLFWTVFSVPHKIALQIIGQLRSIINLFVEIFEILKKNSNLTFRFLSPRYWQNKIKIF
ncbi:hypothetical protein SSS_05237 [Sarcoptes scabiei]|uniref:Uncharacterized protein n=1 Tax=Sarcoptes scabiei TaxID=52283 RepID=A0A834RH54_SARSC|nr:hypothetical protein SSS_05237 [Sarcoptes scabiei]